MEKSEIKGKWEAPTWMWMLLIIAIIASFSYWSWYEENWSKSGSATNAGDLSSGKIIPHKDLCPCEKPKARVSQKKSKPKQKPVIRKEAKSEPTTIVPSIVQTVSPKVETVALSQEEDFYDKAVMPKTWATKPEEEVAEAEPPRVGRKILVIRQQPMMPYYGGYSTSYYQPHTYAPQVTYGQPYIPPPQTVFVPAPPMIVPAPSVVTPAGGYKPQGSTGGHSPSGTTGTAL